MQHSTNLKKGNTGNNTLGSEYRTHRVHWSPICTSQSRHVHIHMQVVVYTYRGRERVGPTYTLSMAGGKRSPAKKGGRGGLVFKVEKGHKGANRPMNTLCVHARWIKVHFGETGKRKR